jgi:integrase
MNFTDAGVRDLEVRARRYEVYDVFPGLLVRIEGSGTKTYYFRYSIRGRVRYCRIAKAAAMNASEARIRARKLSGAVADGRDPQAEKMAQRSTGFTFVELHRRYLEQCAKKYNKSWKDGDRLIRTNVMPFWGNLAAKDVTRAQVKELVGKLSDRPILANAVLAKIAAVFTFAVTEEIVAVNPAAGVPKNPTRERDRVLSEAEVALFWKGCELIDPLRATGLKIILLTGQRPGEVTHMRREHIRDGLWWEMPGQPVRDLKWPGTKNASSHRVFLSAKVRSLIGDDVAGFVFASRDRSERPDLRRGSARGHHDSSPDQERRPDDARPARQERRGLRASGRVLRLSGRPIHRDLGGGGDPLGGYEPGGDRQHTGRHRLSSEISVSDGADRDQGQGVVRVGSGSGRCPDRQQHFVVGRAT